MPDRPTPPGGYPTLKAQTKALRTRFPILVYAIVATWLMVIVLAVSGAFVIERQANNTRALGLSLCAEVYYLERVALTTTNDRTTAELLSLTQDLRRYVRCDPPKIRHNLPR